MKKILFIILFLLLATNVYADTKSETFYSGDWIPGVYINKVKSGVIHYRQARFIKKKSDDKIAYCIEPFEDMKTSGSYTGYDNDYFKRLGINSSTWNRINLISYYGYGYSGHTSDKWYAITQVMIWREVDKNANFYFTDKLNGSKINSYDDEMNEINNLVSNHNKLPSFSNKSFIYSINSINELKDSNNVLNEFSISTNKDIKISKSANKLTIKTENEANTSIFFEKKFDNYNSKTYVFVDNNYQNLIVPGNVDSLKFNININVIGGKIKIIKLDYDNNSKEPSGEGTLIGTKYLVYDQNQNVVDTLVIDENNEAISKLLPLGKYYVKEYEVMDGYTIDDKLHEIIIDDKNSFVEISLKSKIIKSKLEILKYFDEKFESGISFEIYDSKENLVNTVTTDENGKIEIELVYGKYIIHQLNSTKNYKCVDDFEVVIDSKSPEVIKIELHDEKFNSKLLITKKDSKTGKIIESESVFKIFDIYENKYVKINDSEELKTVSGKIIIDKLDAGEYYLEEYKAPKGYSKKNEKIKFNIDDSNVFKYEDSTPILEIDVYNNLEKIDIEVPDTYQEMEQELFAIIYDKKKKLTSPC